MAETLGSLCDKLATVKLKLWHTDDAQRLESLRKQEQQLHHEIDEFMSSAISGQIPIERLTFAQNKVYKKEGNAVPEFNGSLGETFAQLAHTVCKLWHVQEKVYEFESVPLNQKDNVIKELAIVNLERNQCIDGLDQRFRELIAAARADR
ncbi:MAG: hypothetical protein ABR607_09650 [Pyrinomonadaceae bacterium]